MPDFCHCLYLPLLWVAVGAVWAVVVVPVVGRYLFINISFFVLMCFCFCCRCRCGCGQFLFRFVCFLCTLAIHCQTDRLQLVGLLFTLVSLSPLQLNRFRASFDSVSFYVSGLGLSFGSVSVLDNADLRLFGSVRRR